MNNSSGLEKELRKKFGKNIELVKKNVEPLLPLGENYAEKILKLDIVIRKDDKEQELNLGAKMMPDSEFLKNMFDSSAAMEKETFLYEELVPAYQKLESELGVCRLFDIVPEFYGAQFFTQPDGEMNDDAVLLMQNLNYQGFYMEDRRIGLDLEHTKVVLTALARFHALGIAMKQHKPDYFEILKKRSKCINLQFNDAANEVQEFFLDAIRKNMDDPEVFVHIEEAMRRDYKKNFFVEASEPWATVIHSDLWINNFMFRKDGEKVADVKFIDFQNFRRP